jgi:cytochrome P450
MSPRDAVKVSGTCPRFSDFDPLDPDQIRDPYPVLTKARADQPIFWMEKYGMWVVTKREDVWEAYRDQKSFSNAIGHQPLSPRPQSVVDRKGEWHLPIDGNINTIDQPIHIPLKRAFKAALERAMDEIDEWLDQRIDSLISIFEDRVEVDLVEAFTWPLAVGTAAHLIGAPDEDSFRFKGWAEGWFELSGSSHLSAERGEECWLGFVDFEEYVEDLVEKRRSNPQADFVSYLIEEQNKGAAITDRQIVTNTIAAVVAASDTSANAIAQMMHLLLTHPTWLAEARHNAVLHDHILEESLRLRGPVRGEIRTVTRDVILSGISIPKGAKVYLHLGSASRDEAVFTRADQFNPYRENLKRHMAFGALNRLCIGAPLARMEMRKSLSALLGRFANLRLAEEQGLLAYTESMIVPSLRSLRICL